METGASTSSNLVVLQRIPTIVYKSLLSQFASNRMESKPSPLRAFSDFMAKLFVEEDAVEQEDDPPLRAFSNSMAALFVEEYIEDRKDRKTETLKRHSRMQVSYDLRAKPRKTEALRRYRHMQVSTDLQAKPSHTAPKWRLCLVQVGTEMTAISRQTDAAKAE